MTPITFLQKTALFSNIPESDLQQISKDMAKRPFSPGDIIFHEGDTGEMLYLLKFGSVRIYVNGMDGSETSVILIGSPGQLFGELAMIDGLPRSATAVAMTPTLLYTLNRQTFRAHLRRYPQFGLNFMEELSTRVRYNTRQMESFASLDVSQRLARKLIELAQNYGQVQPNSNGISINMTLTQSDLASLIGATRESINKNLRTFRRHHWIHIHHGHITILNPEALRAQATS
jgi:CRP/FNR family transcriptional regulator/CRP/FNR family cyclic AMP-dependent transcriptional regulator